MQAEDCKMNCCTIWFQIDHFQRVFLSHETLREWKQGKGRGNDLFWGVCLPALVSREFTGLKKKKEKKKKQENSIGRALSILDLWEKKQRMLLLCQAYILLISSIVFTLYCMLSSSLVRERKG